MKDPKLTFIGTVKGGIITLPKHLRKEVVEVFEGRDIEVIFQRKRKRRSDMQNKYYWAVVVPEIVRGMIDLGNEALQMGNNDHVLLVHEFLKDTLLDNGVDIIGIEGEMFKMPPSTTRCSTTEFMEFIERARMWAGEKLGINIPGPNEQAEMFEEHSH